MIILKLGLVKLGLTSRLDGLILLRYNFYAVR